MEKQFTHLLGKYYKISPVHFFSIKNVEIVDFGDKPVLSIRTFNFLFSHNKFDIEWSGHQTRELDFDFSKLVVDKKEILDLIADYI